MFITGKISITSVLPKELDMLKEISYDLWWSWNSEAIDLYREIDLELWERLGKNPVRFLQEVGQSKLENKLADKDYLSRYNKVVDSYLSYMDNKETWFDKEISIPREKAGIAYFSAEYGLNEVLPIYSGGLGVLSGDHCKAASDLGLPFTAIGIFYKQGYFHQKLNHQGWQETNYTSLNISHLPIRPALNKNGEQVIVNIELPGRLVYLKVWKVKIGRVNLYLLDSDVESNASYDRALTARLYGGDQETRIQQEIILGIGGVHALDALDIHPAVYHMNEGHSSFLGLELIRKLIHHKGLTFREAKEALSACLVFTTHTPVPAGNDVFPPHMIDKYFANFWSDIGIGRQEFMELGTRCSDTYNFNMTLLSLNLAGKSNGVSELHGAVTRNIFHDLWTGIPEDEIPVSHITNGIHTLTWLSPNFRKLYDKYLDQNWISNLHDREAWKKIAAIPDREMWDTHKALKCKMINFLRDRLKLQAQTNGESPDRMRELDSILDPDALTIGFARRFATYKRANLIFRNLERIKKILNKPDMPVQIIFAGKAHPADGPAQEVIKNISDISRQEGFNGKVVIVENYNMTLARNMVQGVDIWLNNPRRPLEASGTSGQKVTINGILNFSVLDGWWCEGYNGKNGWAIGDDTFYGNEYYQDNADSDSIYDILENQIVPLFYERNDNGIPSRWIQTMKESIMSLAWNYSTQRMLLDYFNNMYLPSINYIDEINSSNYNNVKNIVEWKSFVARNWPLVQLLPEKSTGHLSEYKSVSGQTLEFSLNVILGELTPSDVKVELYYGTPSKENLIEVSGIVEMQPERLEAGNTIYKARIALDEGGEYSYTYRIYPYNRRNLKPFEMRLIKWVN